MPSGVLRACKGEHSQGYEGMRDGSRPAGSRGRSPGRESGDEVPQKLTMFCEFMLLEWTLVKDANHLLFIL